MSFYINVLNFFLPEPTPLFDVAPGPLHEGSDVDGSADQRISGIAHVRGQRQTPLNTTKLRNVIKFIQNCDNGIDSRKCQIHLGYYAMCTKQMLNGYET